MASQNRQTRTSSSVMPSSRDNRPVPQQKQKSQRHQLQCPADKGIEQGQIHHKLPREIQQSILDVFTQAFPVISQQDDLKRVMQEVKGHLYNRDFLTAFSKQEYLDVYAVRWSAARALAYADIFTQPGRCEWFQTIHNTPQPVYAGEESASTRQDPVVSSSIFDHCTNGLNTVNEIDLPPLVRDPSATSPSNSLPSCVQETSDVDPDCQSSSDSQVKVVCIGGGAGAEIVALAATSRHLYSNIDDVGARSNVADGAFVPPEFLNIHTIDIADWSGPVQKLASVLTMPPPLPTYASQAARDANRPLLDADADNKVIVSFSQHDVLQMSLKALNSMLYNVSLITIMFTLNELFSTSLPKTTAFLLNLTEAVAVGTYMVVVDSPGSYSEIQVGKSCQPGNDQNVKKYPMKWLLDHTLLNVAGKGKDVRWNKIEDDDSRWFRIDDKLDLKYPIDLENCRYQIHVFRKVK